MSLPKFQAGMRFDQLRATELRALVDEVIALRKENDENRRQLRSLGANNRDDSLWGFQPKTVLIVDEKPGEWYFEVQEIVSVEPLPKPCDSQCYLRRGEKFKAYPPLGKTKDDFSEFFATGTTALDADAPYLTAFFQLGSWRLFQAGGGGGGTQIRWARVTGFEGANALRVRRIAITPEGAWADVPGVSEEIVLTHPNYHSVLWSDFVGNVDIIIPLVSHGSTWIALLTIPFYPRTGTPGLVHNDCEIS
jgi:hypothetical protein